MKIQRTYDSMPVSLEVWCDRYGFGVTLARSRDLPANLTYRASLTPPAGIKCGAILSSSTAAWGATEQAAMVALAQLLSNRWLVTDVYGPNRQDYHTPSLQWLGQVP